LSRTPRTLVTRARRVVVKVGSAVLTTEGLGLDRARIEALTSELATLKAAGRDVVLVSSGAIAAGFAKLGLSGSRRNASLPFKQAAAAVGQSALMWSYESAFSVHGIRVAQVLLTADDLASRPRFLNARSTMVALLDREVIPVVNENDTVAVEEIKFGDNDNLSAMVAHLVDADLLILLSDVEGLYSADPKHNPTARLVPVVERLSGSLAEAAGGASSVGTGGMRSKVSAARKLTARGVPVVIASGRRERVLGDLFDGREVGTIFLPQAHPSRGRKHWIAHIAAPRGSISVDAGALAALVSRGKSLLPGGVTAVSGSFRMGDCVTCLDPGGRPFARGLIRYSASDLTRIKGLRTSQIALVLGRKDYDEVIHRDDLALLGRDDVSPPR
jgi:glutamate 5-kinase